MARIGRGIALERRQREHQAVLAHHERRWCAGPAAEPPEPAAEQIGWAKLDRVPGEGIDGAQRRRGRIAREFTGLAKWWPFLQAGGPGPGGHEVEGVSFSEAPAREHPLLADRLRKAFAARLEARYPMGGVVAVHGAGARWLRTAGQQHHAGARYHERDERAPKGPDQ